ncbi:MAG: CBS domain-containing protein [Oscillospiraceae bacterium]|nr:CBS domain-containing protein [Oscillospiraceae bacterium]
MNNILFFLTPKAMCAFLYDDYTIRQALEKMEAAHYAALPILNRRGEYRGTLTEGDLLWAMKNMCYMDMRQAEARRIMEISRRKDNVPVRVTTSMQDLVERASSQNFVPVVDDKDAFIGIITRRAIINYCKETLFPED